MLSIALTIGVSRLQDANHSDRVDRANNPNIRTAISGDVMISNQHMHTCC